jgi:hypothetical protein
MAHPFRNITFWPFVLFAFAISSAQTERFIPDSAAAADLWHISGSTQLYVGASFYYMNPLDSIIVWPDTSDADTTGTLYFMVPGYMDSALALFTNRQLGARANISKMVPGIRPGTEIFFMYKSVGRKYPRYTGQNRLGFDPKNQTAYPGAKFVSRDFGLKPGFGHRFAVAGRLGALGGVANDTIVFGFEDGGTSVIAGFDSLVAADFDFNDVIFRAIGLDLNIEAIPDSIVIVCADTARAGDSVLCRAEVWSDSGGIRVRSPQFDSLVAWGLSGRMLLKDSLVPSAIKGSAVFLPRTAFEKFTLRASLRSFFTGDTLRSSKNIWVNPGPPQTLSIELRRDTASPNFSLHATVQIAMVQIPSNTLSLSLYAITRDRFGNFAGFAASPSWDTAYRTTLPNSRPGVVSVRAGNLRGEGIVEKKTGSGNALVFAEYETGTLTLLDTVIVSVVAADYDSLSICAARGDSLVPIKTCTMTMDQCTTFVAIGRRVDSRSWERLQTEWRFSPWFSAPVSGADSVRFCPADTGTGTISINYQDRVWQTAALRVVPGAPVALHIFTDKAAPFPPDTFVNAGAPLQLFARVFDAHGIWLTRTSADQISWTVMEHSAALGPADSSGRLSASSGTPVVYFPQRSPRTVTVRAAYAGLRDTVAASIRPGKPYRISIESSSDWRLSPYAPDPIDTLAIPDNRTSRSVWALVRDSLGNFVDLLNGASWSASDTIISVQSREPGEGIVIKSLQVSAGMCALSVSRPSSRLIGDTAVVKLLPYHYTSLRIVAGADMQLDSLIMSTNDDTTLKAQALRSDTAVWCDVAARWTITDSLVAAPAAAAVFRFSPVKPGTGFVAAALTGIDALADTVRAIFTRGDPVRAELIIITSDEKRVAGDTMRAVVRIYNTDGLVPGAYCYGKESPNLPAAYQDSLGYGGGPFVPRVVSGKGSGDIAVPPSVGEGIPQCFLDGIDSIGLVLYYAPFAKDSLHRLVVKLGDISGDAAPFRLRPSTLASLRLFHSNYCCGDTLVLRYPRERALVYAIGRDRFENVTGEEFSSWATSGTLHAVPPAAIGSRIMYTADSASVKGDEEGFIVAASLANPAVTDSLWTLVLGPQAEALSAITRDDDGNGLLDGIVVRFNKPVHERDNGLHRLFTATQPDASLTIDSASVSPDSMSVLLHLKEEPGFALQTDWTPLISFHNEEFALAGATDSFSMQADDGAGPVVDFVVKEIKGEDRRGDLVTVAFSEPVTDREGNAVSFLTSPDSLFSAWFIGQSDSFEPVLMFDGIGELTAPTEEGRLRFRMANGKELTASHYLNLRADDRAAPLLDKAGNRPSTLNRKVKVVVKGDPSGVLTIGPNPSSPTLLREGAGEFHLEHNPRATDWVARDRAGFAIRFQVVLPEGKSREIGGRLNIFDVIGNSVTGDPVIRYQWKNIVKGGRIINNQNRGNLLPSTWNPNGTVYDYLVYWNGYAKNRRKAAPGVYQAILTLFIKTDGITETKTLTGLIGVKP